MDDQYGNEYYISVYLNEYKLEALSAENGKAVIEKGQQNPEFGLGLIYINLPVLDGDKAAKIIRSKRTALRLIAQTAYG